MYNIRSIGVGQSPIGESCLNISLEIQEILVCEVSLNALAVEKVTVAPCSGLDTKNTRVLSSQSNRTAEVDQMTTDGVVCNI